MLTRLDEKPGPAARVTLKPTDGGVVVADRSSRAPRGRLGDQRGLHRGEDLTAERATTDRVEREGGSGLADRGRQLLTKVGVGGVHDAIRPGCSRRALVRFIIGAWRRKHRA